MKDKLLSLYNELLDPNVSIPQEFKEGIVVFIQKVQEVIPLKSCAPLHYLTAIIKSQLVS